MANLNQNEMRPKVTGLMLVAAFLGATISATQAQSGIDWASLQGRWAASEAACGEDSDAVTTINRSELSEHELSCRTTDRRRMPSGWQILQVCEDDEGARSQRRVRITIMDRSRIRVTTQEQDGQEVDRMLLRCAPPTGARSPAVDARREAFGPPSPGYRPVPPPAGGPTQLIPGSRDPSQQAAVEEQRRRQADARLAELEARRQAEAQRDAEHRQQQEAAQATARTLIESRLSLLSAEARSFVEQNPGMKEPGFGETGESNLLYLYSGDIVLRVCRERFGGYQPQITEIQRRSGLTEAVLLTLHGVPREKIARLREALGIDSGRGQLVSAARQEPNLRQACGEYVATLGLDPPLAR
jgi:hypothetical protein